MKLGHAGEGWGFKGTRWVLQGHRLRTEYEFGVIQKTEIQMGV